MISPEFWSDEKIGRLSLTARLLYIGIWNFADDDGRFQADAKLLRASIFPYGDKISITRAMSELAEQKLVIYYRIGSCSFGFVPRWSKWQKIDKYRPSNLPEPPTIENDGIFDESSGNGQVELLPNRIEQNRIEYIPYGFDQFWNDYPKKISKKKALQSWTRLKPDQELVKVILNAVRNQSRSEQWLKDKGQYIPHPATWLNQERWNDELVTAPGVFQKSKQDRKPKSDCEVCNGSGKTPDNQICYCWS